MDQASAENVANYSIDNGITVNSGFLEADQVTVTLTTTTAHTPGVTYTLTVTGVANPSGNVMAATQGNRIFLKADHPLASPVRSERIVVPAEAGIQGMILDTGGSRCDG